MSRGVKPPVAQPAGSAVKVPAEKIARRAYEKWLQRGQPHGGDIKDWIEAENELRAEMTRSAAPSTPNTPSAPATRSRR
jgi:hypothetical protein